MPAMNRFSRVISKIDKLPRPLRTRARTLLLGRMVKFVGTARLDVEELSAERAVVAVKNRPIVRNHIGTVHAAAMTLLAETATGFVVGMSLPDDRVQVVKSIKVDFRKRATGSLRAIAELTQEQRAAIESSEKGEVLVKVTVTDEKGIEPIACEMIWAWTPKRR
jgi:acyl-coenzyme A thioesterase PaaI-like protein